MRSMTGFGQAAGENEGLRVNVSLRGVNHRFLDLSLRPRDDWRAFESDVRDVLAARLHRGRVEVGVEIEYLAARPVDLRFDEAAVEALAAGYRRLSEHEWIAGGLSFGDLLRLPDVLRLESRDPEWPDADRELLLSVVSDALEQLLAARRLEGDSLKQALEQRLDGLETITAALRTRAAEMPAEIAATLETRIRELTDSPDLDPNRLAQEVALLVDRSDVSEEIDRLGAHLEHYRTILEQTGSLGKRLDFLTQEVFRELNTIGTKCRDTKMTRQVLDGKVLCEQLREQIQNVE